MSVIRIAIVEDEELYLDKLKMFIEQFRKEKGVSIITSEFRDGEDITENYQPEYDIILMDIQMSYMDGMTAAKKIREWDSAVIIIFITNMAGFAIQGYEVEALDYILKPLSYDMFSKKMERALRFVSQSDTGEYLLIAMKEYTVKLELSRILYIEARGHQMEYHTADQIYAVRGRMEELEKNLAEKGFFRSNRGYLVNLYHITSITNDCCVVGGELLPISRNRRNILLEKLSEIL